MEKCHDLEKTDGYGVVNQSTETPEREEKLDRFMERWVELDEARAEKEEARTEREEARRAADRQHAAEQQD